MKKVILIDRYNRKKTENYAEPGGGEDMTQQGEAWTIKELFQRAMQGVSPNVERIVQYDPDGSEESDVFTSKAPLDITDLDEAKLKLNEIADEVKKNATDKSKGSTKETNPDQVDEPAKKPDPDSEAS